MKDGRIVTGDELLESDTTLECDVCIIGSGSGGAWLAHELCAAGKDVVMLEEGGYHTRREFDLTEAHVYPKLYQELGNRATDDLSITMLQGRSVGGSTTVNWCSSFRTPERILKIWREQHGCEALTPQTLDPHWAAAEKRLHIAEWPEALINRNNRILWEGLGKLGYDRGLIRRNVNGCANLGYCGLGCPIDAKQSMGVTVLPDAVEKGLRLFANVSVRRLETQGKKVTRVVADVLDPQTDRKSGRSFTVKAKATAVCGGAVNSPALLLRSGLDAEGRVGARTWLHPVVVMLSEFAEPVNAFSGAPQSVYSHQFIERGEGKMGFFLEVPPVHPMLASVVSTGMGAQLQSFLGRLPYVNAMIAIVVDGLLPHETGGTVRLRDSGYGRHSISYDFVPQFWEAARTACREMARLQFAAGAKRVHSLHQTPLTLESEADLGKLDQAEWEKIKVRVVSAHLMGGCAMGKDASKSVVDPQLRFHGLDNLFVVDGSVFPTSLGVNPQLTIFGLARWASQHVAAAV
ncbi:MAG: GMC family oxidoreductase [Archangiaceae bacterium]|nr:GMC family oxidoreductase [Archangiaceae bacterium]